MGFKAALKQMLHPFWDAHLYLRYGRVRRYAKKIKLRDAMQVLPHEDAGYVFTCWWQGLENAPEIVKVCVGRMRQRFGDRLVVIDENNYHDWVTMPADIIAQMERGKISKTLFSDLLRLELLIKFGGSWLDATVFVTDNYPEYVQNADLFLFQDCQVDKYATKKLKTDITNYFIRATSNNKLLIMERDLLYYYWRHYHRHKQYFIFHYFFTNIVLKFYYAEYNSIIEYSKLPTKLLSLHLFEPYQPTLYKNLLSMSFLHKLSYKYAPEKYNLPDTIYQHLLQEK